MGEGPIVSKTRWVREGAITIETTWVVCVVIDMGSLTMPWGDVIIVDVAHIDDDIGGVALIVVVMDMVCIDNDVGGVTLVIIMDVACVDNNMGGVALVVVVDMPHP